MSFTSRIASAAARGYGMFRIAAAAAVDPFFNYVTALLHGDGTNGAQNNTFLDSSTNNFTITRNGNTTQGTFSPFSQTGWSAYFDGSGDYINFTNQATTGSFTCECWFYRGENVGGYNIIFGGSNASNANPNNVQLYVDNSGNVGFVLNGAAVIAATGLAVTRNAWNHIAWVRSGTSCAIFVNGLRIGTGTSSAALNVDRIGTAGALGPGTYDALGYISNARITTTAVYDVAQTTCTVPTTPLTAISGTYLLTLQSNRFVDNSASPLTLTVNGTPSVQAFSPFNPTSAWSASSNGGSGYFDGSGDYLSIAYNSAFNFGTGDFTIECWVYPVGNQTLYTGIATQNGSTNGWYLSFGNSNAVRFTDYATAYLTSSSSVNPNSWTHVAVTRSGTAMKMFFNGVVVASTTSSATFGEAFPVVVGFNAANYFLGYITDLRLVKGTAVYTAAFTPPTAPLTAITNTSLLLNYTNAGIYDNAAVGDYETVGNAQVSTSVKKYGTGSVYFDGVGDYLTIPYGQSQNFGTGDFTIEGWFYLNSLANSYYVLGGTWSSATSDEWLIQVQNNGSLRFLTTADTAFYATGLIKTGTWYHFAASRSAGVIKAYINGTAFATITNANSIGSVSKTLNIGQQPGGTWPWDGYLDDWRITKGVGRYPYNFTPPTAAFPNIGGTVTLTADPYYNYTTLLLPGNGTNGAQNNTFLDSSSNAFTITRNGNTTQGNFSPFSQTGWGNYFNGTSAYLTTPVFGAGNGAGLFTSGATFTVETWLYQSAFVTTAGYVNTIIGDLTPTAATALWWAIGTDSSNAPVLRWYDGVVKTCTGATALITNSWNHVAFVCNAGAVTIYVNGTAQGLSGTTTITTPTGTTGNLYVGADRGNYVTGYFSNLRVVKNSAVYTSNFTPSTTPLTAITNTSLLTCQSNRFIDNSSNAFALTVTGSPSVQAFSPFAPTAAWTASTNGGSGYYDGSGDYLAYAVNNSSITNWYSQSTTIEAWIYPTASVSYTNNYPSIVTNGSPSSSTNYWGFGINGQKVRFAYFSGSGQSVESTGSVPLNAWTHIAFVYNNSDSSIKLYINGVLDGSGTKSGSPQSDATLGLLTGGWFGGSFAGYIASLRIVTGTAVYTANFTPPTAPLTAISGTSLLLSATNGGITDATAKNDLETVGNAQISTTQSKFGGSSIYLDGTGDWLIGKSSVLASFGTGDFTIEGWVYPSAVTGTDRCLWDTRATASDTGMVVFIDTNGKISTYTSAAIRITSTNALTANTWQHFALCRYNGTMAVYINGIQNGTLAYSTTITCPGRISVGVRFDDLAPYTGYIDDFRVTPGIARYTSNFTPPTTAFLTL